MRWFRIFLAIGLSCCISAQAAAQGVRASRAAKAPEGAYAPNEPTGFTETNGDHRQFGAQVKYGTEGLGVFMPGLEGVLFLAARWQLYLAASQGSGPYNYSIDAVQGNSESVIIVGADLKSTNFAAGGRFFFGRNFFLTLGVIYATDVFDVSTQIQASGSNASQDGAADISATAQSILGHGALGYQWAFGNGLLITAEWLGFSYPISISQTYSPNGKSPDKSGSGGTSSLTGGTAGSSASSDSRYDASNTAIANVVAKPRITTSLAVGWAM